MGQKGAENARDLDRIRVSRGAGTTHLRTLTNPLGPIPSRRRCHRASWALSSLGQLDEDLFWSASSSPDGRGARPLASHRSHTPLTLGVLTGPPFLSSRRSAGPHLMRRRAENGQRQREGAASWLLPRTCGRVHCAAEQSQDEQRV